LPTLELIAWVKIVRKASPITPQFSSGDLDRRLDLRKLANKEKKENKKEKYWLPLSGICSPKVIVNGFDRLF